MTIALSLTHSDNLQQPQAKLDFCHPCCDYWYPTCVSCIEIIANSVWYFIWGTFSWEDTSIQTNLLLWIWLYSTKWLVAVMRRDHDYAWTYLILMSFNSKTCLQGTLWWKDTLWSGDVFSERCPIFPMIINLCWRDTSYMFVGTFSMRYWSVPWRQVLLYIFHCTVPRLDRKGVCKGYSLRIIFPQSKSDQT